MFTLKLITHTHTHNTETDTHARRHVYTPTHTHVSVATAARHLPDDVAAVWTQLQESCKCPLPLTKASGCCPWLSACVWVCMHVCVWVCLCGKCLPWRLCDSFLIVALSFSMENCGIYLMIAFLYHYTTYTHSHTHTRTLTHTRTQNLWCWVCAACVFPTNLVTTPQGVPADDHQQPPPSLLPDTDSTDTLIYIAPLWHVLAVCVCECVVVCVGQSAHAFGFHFCWFNL